jgi:hypothetical protein
MCHVDIYIMADSDPALPILLVAACAPPNGRINEAEMLYLQGQELRTVEEYDAALEKFRASNAKAIEA